MAVIGKFLVTVPSSSVTGGPHSHFPVLVDSRVTDIPSDFWAAVTAAGGSSYIKVWNGDEDTEYDREIVNFNEGSELLELWIRVPLLSSATDNTFYIRVEDGSRANDTGVWTNGGYALVNHFQEASGNPSDSTGNYIGTAANVSYGANGKIGNAFDFNGNNSSVNHGNVVEENGAENITYSMWLSQDVLNQGDNPKLRIDGINRIQINFDTSNSLRFAFSAATNLTKVKSINSYISAGSLFHLTIPYNGSLATNLLKAPIYINGVQMADEDSGTIPAVLPNLSSADSYIGYTSASLDGKIDEYRVNTNTLTASWITTEYSNQNDPDSFLSCGTWDTGSSSSQSSNSSESTSSESSESSNLSPSSESSESSSESSLSASVSSSQSVSVSSLSVGPIVDPTDCIQAQITASLKTALAAIGGAGYKNTVSAVEEERRFLQINGRFPFILILEDEPTAGNYQNIERLEYDLWWFPSWCDRVEGVATADADTEMANYLRNVMADMAKAIDQDFNMGGLAEKCELMHGTYDLYTSANAILIGIWSKLLVSTKIDITNPYRIR